ncbi:hypothetical protein [Nonomuraea gerenzanensis]|uniref:Secreted protein n=1 Tax=Nonomuraea gerenzanensis TaxID=93944 RepID=A0A1M4EQE6_9ACTN|nr:hypothetical protein [Nonomuraea gerenzanensis]UBU12493.1 hypothetical protein LCN96_50870 [Nonomuraea gerenzanensis]SBP01048.1 hypothetical protein BN4615_P10564 [Nonomuraea gerenzanensis]
MQTYSRRRFAATTLACALVLAGGTAGAAEAAAATRGEQVVERARKNYLVPDATVKADVDVLRNALKEVKAGKSVTFNANAGRTRIRHALGVLGRTAEEQAVLARWAGLVADRGGGGTAAYLARERQFFAAFTTPLGRLTQKYPKSQAKYWLKNTPPQVLDVVFTAATAGLPPDQLYTYAYLEGLVDYVRDRIGLGRQAGDPTDAQLRSVPTTSPIFGYDYLGTDRFFLDMSAARVPGRSFLPYDPKRVVLDTRRNEKGTLVESALFPDLTTGLQGEAAMLLRRRALFLADVKTYGYAAPTRDELVYWTYVYYNVGEFNGQLKKYAGRRALGDWIAKGEYPNSIKALESWRMLRDMKIF